MTSPSPDEAGATPPTKWGFCFAGNEAAFCDAIRETICGPVWSYLEIGVGNGDCLRAVADFVTGLGLAEWRVHGVDLGGLRGPAIEPATYYPHEFRCRRRQDAPHAPSCSISLYLTSAAVFLHGSPMRFDYAFIDGCHGAPCVTADFLGVEPLIRGGGIVCFHDTSPNCQGRHPQPHCGTGIAARAAVEKLGLLDNTRPGWVVHHETQGDESKGGHGSLWVKKL